MVRLSTKLIVALVVAIMLLLSVFVFDAQQFLSLSTLKQELANLVRWQQDNLFGFSLAFFLIYVLVTTLSIPGAAVLTLAAGALFGFWWGLLMVSFASTIGATLAFVVARFVLRDWVQQRFQHRLTKINQGIEREGGFYLFSLRLIPLFPFFLINLVMALTPIKTWRFYWVSQLGMLPGTMIYVNAGMQLSQLQSLAGILSPSLLLAFLMIGLFPLVAAWGLKLWRQHHVYRPYAKPRRFDNNLIVIGAGAGGLVSAYIGATVKAKVTLIEQGPMGGDCLNYGCVPSKALLNIARAGGASWEEVQQHIQHAVEAIAPHDSVERYQNLGVNVISGRAQLLDPWTVQVTLDDGKEQRLNARSIILATGSKPLIPDIPGLSEANYFTNETLWHELKQRPMAPASMVILGAGAIGCELALALAQLGISVTLVEQGQQILSTEDAEVIESAQQVLLANGVNLLTAQVVERIETLAGGTELSPQQVLHLSASDRSQSIKTDCLLIATGREPRLQGLGIEALGLITDGKLTVNEFLATRFANIYGVGDVIGPYRFTHVAAHQAWYGSVNSLFGLFKKFAVDYRVIPRTLFLNPEIARVGLNEREAKAQGVKYEISTFSLAELDRAITDQATTGFVKILTVPGKDKILGATIVAERAGEMIIEYVLAMKYGLGLSKLLATIRPYPTWSEANKYAAGAWKRAHAPDQLLRWVERYHSWRRG